MSDFTRRPNDLSACSPSPSITANERSPRCRTRSKLRNQGLGRKPQLYWGSPGPLAGGASGAAVGPAGDTPTENTAPLITLGDEEISDVSLTTFYVFDNEHAGSHRPGLQIARARGRGGCRSCAVPRGCGDRGGACGGESPGGVDNY